MKGSVSDWLRLARIEHSFLVLIAIIISELLTLKYIGGDVDSYADQILFPAFGPFLIVAAAFILNDYFGFKTDKANKRHERPLVAGKIKKEDALRVSVILFSAGLLLTLFVNIYCFVIAFIFTALSAIYDNYLKRKPLLGNAYIASSMAISFIYGNFAITTEIQEIILLFVAISFLAGMGRELIITLRDVKGDKKISAVTAPMILGKNNTLQLSAAFLICSIFLSWAPINGSYLSLYAILIYANNLLLLYSVFLIFQKGSKENFKRARNLTLLALLIGLIAFATLAF